MFYLTFKLKMNNLKIALVPNHISTNLQYIYLIFLALQEGWKIHYLWIGKNGTNIHMI